MATHTVFRTTSFAAITMSALLLAACDADPVAVEAPTVSAAISRYTKNSGPPMNPHKGWNSAWGSTFEEATVGFQYISWGCLEPRDNEFDWACVERTIAKTGSKQKHFVLRLYCDWARTDVKSNCPDWIFTQKGVQRITGADNTYITDYNNPNFVSEAVQAIQALGARYDNDPRVHAFQIGVLGYWGEWHTHNFRYVGGGGYTIAPATQTAILDAYKTSFTRARLQGRYPWREPLRSLGGIGFHNDYFIPNNAHSNDFDTALDGGGQWLNGPIGGETPPRDDAQREAERNLMFNTPAGASMIARGHYSTMNGGYRVGPTDPRYASSMALHRMMGYNYQIESARFDRLLYPAETLTVRLAATNIGVAPMYYDWTMQFALLNTSDDAVALLAPATDLRTASIKPGDAFTATAGLRLNSVASGRYRVAVRLIQPGADTPKSERWKLDARNTYILFANELPVVEGTWGADNALQGGWSVLGTIRVR